MAIAARRAVDVAVRSADVAGCEARCWPSVKPALPRVADVCRAPAPAVGRAVNSSSAPHRLRPPPSTRCSDELTDTEDRVDIVSTEMPLGARDREVVDRERPARPP